LAKLCFGALWKPYLLNESLLLRVCVVEDEDNEEVFSDEEFEAEMKQKQRRITPQVCHCLSAISTGC